MAFSDSEDDYCYLQSGQGSPPPDFVPSSSPLVPVRDQIDWLAGIQSQGENDVLFSNFNSTFSGNIICFRIGRCWKFLCMLENYIIYSKHLKSERSDFGQDRFGSVEQQFRFQRCLKSEQNHIKNGLV